MSQYALFPLTLGTIVLLGGAAGLYLWARDLQSAAGLDYWMPLIICFSAVSAGIYLIFWRPSFTRVVFAREAPELVARDLALGRRQRGHKVHSGLETMSVLAEDSDGYWYTPVITLVDGQLFRIGYGCATPDGAQAVINQIIMLHKESGE